MDAAQLATAPAELTGPVAWVVESGLDIGALVAMVVLVGFHWVFLPSFVTKVLPVIDIAPTWPLAVR